jgi:thiamine biosynthesis lipoprotein
MARRAFVEQIMGLPVSVHVRGPTVADAATTEAAAAVFTELRVIDALFSTYREDSHISAMNRGEPVHDPLVDTVVELCEQARERTGGYFDAHLPGGFDPSGLVKGWAVERAAARLGRREHYVSAGGDLVVRGTWRIGVEDPAQPDRLLAIVHIINPHTGLPARGLDSATVIGPSLTWADVYATAAVARGPEAVTWLAGLPGYEALLVADDGGLLATPGWPGRR